MKKLSITCSLLVLAAVIALISLPAPSSVASSTTAPQKDVFKLKDHVMGSEKAPITIIEYASFTCSHCATFYNEVIPKLKKDYIETGKVRLIFHSFASNRYDLKATALIHCAPTQQFYPLVKTFFSTANTWMHAPKPEDVLMQYAGLAGLSREKAKACTEDSKMLDAIVAQRTEAIKTYDIRSTPTFIINESEDKIVGAISYEEFKARLDKILAAK